MKATIDNGVRMVNLRQGMAYTGLGRNLFLQFAGECKAAKRYGRRVVYDLEILDRALDGLPDKENAEAI